MFDKIKQQEWYTKIFAKFERKDFMKIIQYALVFLAIQIISNIAKLQSVSAESLQYQDRLLSFFAFLLIFICLHYIFRIVSYLSYRAKLAYAISKKSKEEF